MWRLQKRRKKELKRVQNEHILTPPFTPSIPRPSSSPRLTASENMSRQQIQERKIYHRMRAKCYSDLKAMSEGVEQLKRKAEMYRKCG